YRPRYKNAAGDIVSAKIWWLKYRANGRVVRESSGTTKETLARGQLRIKEGDAERGIVAPPKVNRKTVAEILAAVLLDYRANGQRWADGVEQRIRLHLGPAFGNRNAARLTDDDVQAFIVAQQAKGLSNAEINLQRAIFNRAYTLARKTVTV